MSRKLLILSLLALVSFAAAASAAQEAVRELGQPDFRGFSPNRLDARGLAYPWGVAIDKSRSPNGIWVLDTSNNRVLGWRDVAALRNGMRADVILGQPDAFTISCNTGGLSASSLCEVESPFSGAYEPGLAVDPEGNLYVVDQFNLRILGYRRPFDTDRVADLVLGQKGFSQTDPPSGGDAEHFYNPHGLAADAQGNLYVADERRVVEFDRPFATDGVVDRVCAENRSDPSAPDQAAYADDVALDAQGRLYVADAFMDRVMIWKEPLVRQGAADLILNQGAITCEYPGCNEKGIEVEPDGDLWVGGHDKGRILGYRSPVDTDTEPDRILQAANSAHVFNPAPPDGRPAYAGGGLAVDETGTLWLVDASRVLGFSDPWDGDDRADRILGQVRPDQIAANLVDRDGLQFPSAIALDTSSSPAHLYVVDTGNHRVLGWADAESFANGQPADLVLGQPDRWKSGCNTGGRSLTSLCLGQIFNGIAVDARGTVWVTDAGNQRVVGYRSPFTTDRAADRVLGGIGGIGGCVTGPRGLCIPGGLAVDKAGNLFVADIGNNRILVFDDPMRRDAVADRVLGADGFHRNLCNTKFSRATCFSQPNSSHPGLDVSGGSLAMDPAGRLLVGNGLAVYVFERPLQAPNRSRRLIDLSSIQASFSDPQSLAVDSAGRIYLTGSPRVYGFSRSGAGPILELGETCTFGNSSGLPENLGPASLCNPMGVAVGPGDELFVSDAGVNRVVVFELP